MRLSKLLPSMEKGTIVRYLAGDYDQSILQIEVVDTDRYTQFLTITGHMTDIPWWGKQRMAVRMYSDAKMAEVVNCGMHRVRLLRYPYPNDKMYSPDEKNKVNEFLGNWLKYFLLRGRKVIDLMEEN